MEQYELTMLFSVRGEHYQSGSEELRALLEKLNGKISQEEDMRERPLAYPVRKELYGHYLHWSIELGGEVIEALKEGLQASVSVLKFLLIKK